MVPKHSSYYWIRSLGRSRSCCCTQDGRGSYVLAGAGRDPAFFESNKLNGSVHPQPRADRARGSGTLIVSMYVPHDEVDGDQVKVAHERKKPSSIFYGVRSIWDGPDRNLCFFAWLLSSTPLSRCECDEARWALAIGRRASGARQRRRRRPRGRAMPAATNVDLVVRI